MQKVQEEAQTPDTRGGHFRHLRGALAVPTKFRNYLK